eukprot:Selendium_serpulae@DN5211_c0_g1_i2.p2
MSQKLIPKVYVSESDTLEVNVTKFVPFLVPVDVYVPVAVDVPFTPITEQPTIDHSPVDVPPAQFNTLLLDINPNLRDEKDKYLPMVRDCAGRTPLLPGAAEWFSGALKRSGTSSYPADTQATRPLKVGRVTNQIKNIDPTKNLYRYAQQPHKQSQQSHKPVRLATSSQIKIWN